MYVVSINTYACIKIIIYAQTMPLVQERQTHDKRNPSQVLRRPSHKRNAKKTKSKVKRKETKRKGTKSKSTRKKTNKHQYIKKKSR